MLNKHINKRVLLMYQKKKGVLLKKKAKQSVEPTTKA